MDIETIRQFIDLKRSKKLNLVLTVFSTIVSGFLIIFVINPSYTKDLSTFHLVLLSLTAVAPIYIFNQILSVIVVSRITKKGLSHLASFAKLPNNQGESINEFTDYIANRLIVNAIYNSPARQTSEMITIIASYVSAILIWVLKFKLIILYVFLVACSSILFLIFYKYACKIISQVTPKQLESLIKKLKKDEDFKKYLSKRLNRIEDIIKEKGQKQQNNN